MIRFPFLRWEFSPRSGLFGSSGSSQQAQQMAMIQMAQQQQAAQNAQGQQLALIAKSQGQNDNETASLSRPGLGRALLAYQPSQRKTLGG